MSEWNRPKELSNLDVGFGPINIGEVLPKWEEIPEEFKKDRGKWQGMVDDMFFNNVKLTNVVMKDGINRSIAIRHMRCVLHSYDPSHEHKTAGVAYLMSLWFEKFEYEKVKEDEL